MKIRTAGDGESVVFLHGCPTTPDVLAPIAARISTFARSVTVTLPGYGGSPALDRPWTLTALHSAIETTLLAHGVASASIVGFSGGAYHALALACRARVRVRSVVSLAGMLSFDGAERDGLRQFAAGLLAGADLRSLAAPRFLSVRARSPANVAAVESWFDATSRQNLAAELAALADAEDLTHRVGALTIPILVRVGAEDVASPPPKSEAIARVSSLGTLQIVPAVGHALMIEDCDATVAAVVAALQA